MARPTPRTLLVLVIVSLVSGCARRVTRALVPPPGLATLDERSPFLKAHLLDGRLYVFSQWQADLSGASILGSGVLLDASRNEIDSGEFRLLADSVVLFETNVEEQSGPGTALTVMVGVTAAVAGICAASPKTCFGSCPTIYVPTEDGHMSLQAEAFSSSIAPALEATDVDMLLHTQAKERSYTIRVTNEALETHVIRHADILAVRRPADGRVYQTSEGNFQEVIESIRPTTCASSDGSCLMEVLQPDGRERTSLADSSNLATRETIDLTFEGLPEQDVGLVVTSRQTLMTTFLIYQALAYMGNDAGRFLARLETGGESARSLAGGMERALGVIEVLVPDEDGEWIVAGTVGEAGPIAVDTRMVKLPRSSGSQFRVRLRMTQGLWRLDQVALVALGNHVAPERIVPVRVSSDGVERPDALEALLDETKTLVTFPGDAYEISYELPEDPLEYELFMESRGYYLEWMRREWLAEENPTRAAQITLDPEGVLRALAPAFKNAEADIERLFWNSRYAP